VIALLRGGFGRTVTSLTPVPDYWHMKE